MDKATLQELVCALAFRQVKVKTGGDEQAVLILHCAQRLADDVGRLIVLVLPVNRDARASSVVILLQRSGEGTFDDHVIVQVLVPSAGVSAEHSLALAIVEGLQLEALEIKPHDVSSLVSASHSAWNCASYR